MSAEATSSKATPFSVLSDIARRSYQMASGLPEQDEAVELFNGIGFSLAGQRYVAPMGEVTEILDVPRFTPVPGVRNFLLGVANVRGRLLPIIDLALFFGVSRPPGNLRERRILVVENGTVFSGLVVDDVLGMQYFSVESHLPDPDEPAEAVHPFLQGAYQRNDEVWKVFSTLSLTENEQFLDVAQW
jgi:twitching motility protein PilI